MPLWLPACLTYVHINYYSRIHGFCKQCGTLGRKDNLRRYHFNFCQPGKSDLESGFLLNGCLPTTGQEDVQMVMALINSGSTTTQLPTKPTADVNSYGAHSANDKRLPISTRSNAGSEINRQNNLTKFQLSGVKTPRKPAQAPQKEYTRKREQKVQLKEC